MECVYCVVRTDSLNVIQVSCHLQGARAQVVSRRCFTADPGSAHLMLVVGKVALGQVFV
jgi:hypothetical protein